MTLFQPPPEVTFEDIFETEPNSDEMGEGVHVSVASDATGIVKVAIIDETNGELVELDPQVAIAVAEAIIGRLKGASFGAARRLH